MRAVTAFVNDMFFYVCAACSIPVMCAIMFCDDAVYLIYVVFINTIAIHTNQNAPDGAAPDGAILKNQSAPDGAAPDGAVNKNQNAPDGAAPDGAVNEYQNHPMVVHPMVLYMKVKSTRWWCTRWCCI